MAPGAAAGTEHARARLGFAAAEDAGDEQRDEHGEDHEDDRQQDRQAPGTASAPVAGPGRVLGGLVGDRLGSVRRLGTPGWQTASCALASLTGATAKAPAAAAAAACADGSGARARPAALRRLPRRDRPPSRDGVARRARLGRGAGSLLISSAATSAGSCSTMSGVAGLGLGSPDGGERLGGGGLVRGQRKGCGAVGHGLRRRRLGLGLRWPRHGGDERGEDLLGHRRIELRLRRIEVRALGRLEARDRRAAGPALGEVRFQSGQVGVGERLLGALGEQTRHRGAVARGHDLACVAAAVRVALMSSASGFRDVASPASTTALRKRAKASAAAGPASDSPATWRQ